jgi:hypothetical protein
LLDPAVTDIAISTPGTLDQAVSGTWDFAWLCSSEAIPQAASS